MTAEQKIEAILDLLTDKNIGKLVKDKTLQGEDEQFGALVFATNAFGKAYKIARGE